jgi:GH25 family lysozyme M1 (1,4-beta-N-acetylmuramidase)
LIFGVDTSGVAGVGTANWLAAKAAVPLGFAILRSNYGETTDSVFAQNWPLLKAAGLVRGAFLFLRFPRNGVAAPEPAAQARAMIATVADLSPDDFPPCVDIEFPAGGRGETGLTASECLDSLRVCCAVLKEHYNVTPLIYTSARVWKEDLDNLPARDLAESPLWLARYPFAAGKAVYDPAAFAVGRLDPPVPLPWGDAWWIHQYQGDAVELPGFEVGKVDMNRFNGLSAGSTGDRAKWVQSRLGLAPTGLIDATTEAAIRAFQAQNGLNADGVVGPRTFARLCWR